MASGSGGGTFHVEFADVAKTGSITVLNTGGWQTWQTLVITNLVLDAGLQIMKLVMENNATGGGDIGNVNSLQLTLVASNHPPSVTLSTPAAGSTFATDTPITITASASDLDGTVSKVEYFQNGNLLGAVTQRTDRFVWSNAPPANYLITARATDNVGNSADSAPRTIKVTTAAAPFTGTLQCARYDSGGGLRWGRRRPGVSRFGRVQQRRTISNNLGGRGILHRRGRWLQRGMDLCG